MNEAEAVALARYVHAVCPQQKFDEYTPDAWSEVLAGYEFADCKQAVIEIARRQPWIAPAEIIDEVKRLRAGRLDYFQYEPDPDETSAQFTRNLKAQIAQVMDGHRPPALEYAGTPRPVLELAAGVGHNAPTADRPQTRLRSALDVRCPRCSAGRHKPCTAPSGRRLAGFHGSRQDALHNAQGAA
ncbi:hypothetical protein ABT093_09930 [Kitasatospora sp. NPDC002551]|uniref:zinc finger domain-containing protein n=1 Tax=Kitasatospora sp. NPDC002551 TaxID=3154539 RepID=UPI0033264C8E